MYESSLALSQMKTNLLTFAAHELKTPLIPIFGWIDLIKSHLEKGHSLDSVVGYEEISSIYNSATRLVTLVENFLDVNRIEMGCLELECNYRPSENFIQNALEAVGPLAESVNIQIHTDLQHSVVWVDALRIEQVLINILSNSIKFSPPGSEIWIFSECSEQTCTVTIIDLGLGLSPGELQEIWHPFSTSFLHKNDGQYVPGTGVGLYITKGIVEQHGGSIQIDSTGKDLGTTVRITLPLNPPSRNGNNETLEDPNH